MLCQACMRRALDTSSFTCGRGPCTAWGPFKQVPHPAAGRPNRFCLQAAELLGMKADELAPLKEAADKDEYEAMLKRCQFTQWVLRVQTRTR